ncbi:hypothetical protein SKAU_G00077180 [Synaphobranchus kaupii]|uniref:Uncharacterized protein n=1 Tax=Synaphobranchus kaupii TaxID=118154 RepID=A0A9Q1G7X3_SYNKA|nr:hypothetical protein SKAU_G00077180 [Synaphobranchus kaupii]
MSEIATAAASAITATAALTEISKRTVGAALRSVIVHLSNYSSNILINPQVYTYSGYCCDPPKPTVRQGVTDVCAFRHTIGAVCGAVGVLTYDIAEHQRMKPVKSLAVMFSVPYNYIHYDNWFSLGLFDIDRACDKSLYEHMYYQKGKFTRGKASGSEIRYQCGKYTLRGTMSPVAKAFMKVEFLDETSFDQFD